MNEPLHPGFTLGTHRLVAPEKTMARVAPLLEPLGITRVAEITGLDEDLGVPTYTAVRPGGLVLQTGNGKGLTAAAARVSAIMEAAELHHAENPDTSRFTPASMNEMRRRGLDILVPQRDQADRIFFFSPEYVIDWVACDELISDRELWIPASAAFFIQPTAYRTNTNGLAAGNHAVEATLHALYEVLERDAISRLAVDGFIDIRGTCRAVSTATIADEPLQHMVEKIRAAGSELVLLSVPTWAPIHVFWAFLLNHRPHRASTALSAGAGAHLDIRVAAARAVTEAIQTRLTLVQAARDDIIEFLSVTGDRREPSGAFRYIAALDSDTHWNELERVAPGSAPPGQDLRQGLEFLLRALEGNGHAEVIRVELTRPEFDIPVVKVIVPSLMFRRELF